MGFLRSSRSPLNFLYFFHDLFVLGIYQVFVQKLIAVMVLTYHEAYRHTFHVMLSFLQYDRTLTKT